MIILTHILNTMNNQSQSIIKKFSTYIKVQPEGVNYFVPIYQTDILLEKELTQKYNELVENLVLNLVLFSSVILQLKYLHLQPKTSFKRKRIARV